MSDSPLVGPPDMVTLFKLKHIMWVVADSGYQVNQNLLPVPLHDVDAS